MLSYNKKIDFGKDAKKQLTITTDRGDNYRSFTCDSENAITEWWKHQHQSTLRIDQKEYLQMLADGYLQLGYQNTALCYVLYQPGDSIYRQKHDMSLWRFPNQDLWVFMTSRHTWFLEESKEIFSITVDQATGGGIQDDKTMRDRIFAHRNLLIKTAKETK